MTEERIRIPADRAALAGAIPRVTNGLHHDVEDTKDACDPGHEHRA